MKYPTREEMIFTPESKPAPYFSVKLVLGLVEKIIGEKLDVAIEKEEELLRFLRSPEFYTDNISIRGKITELNTLLLLLGGDGNGI